MMASSNKDRVTAVVYDERLASHYSLWNKDFTEKPQRYTSVIERCRELKLLERCKRIQVREASESEMLICHTENHLSLLKSTETMDEEELKKISQKYDYIYFHQKSFENAKLALGGIIDLVDDVATCKVTNGMAIIRPPGHHAMSEESCGYCYLSNMAIATKVMMERHKLKRILVFDWDVHHGQGTQFAFYDDPRVLFVSVHRYEYGTEWPNLREGDYDYIGEGAGKGFNINLPLNEIDCGNSDYLPIFFNLLLPIFYEFDPELVLVSAGYDSAIGCPEGEMSVTPACFAHFVNLLLPLASGKLALLLEGGYNLKSLSESAALSLRALLGDPTPAILPLTTPKQSVVESVFNCIKMLHPYWKCLQYQEFVEQSSIDPNTYLYPMVLRMPPMQDIWFHNSETRPELYPLIQACAEDHAIENIEIKNEIIDKLIQETDLSYPECRLGFITDNEDYLDGEVISWMRDPKLCSLLQQNSPASKSVNGTLSSWECVQTAIDAVCSFTVQSSLCIVASPDSSTNSSVKSVTNDKHYITLASQHASKTLGTGRTLIIDIGSSARENPVNIGNSTNLLYVDLSVQVNPGKSCQCPSDQMSSQSSSNCIHVAFPQSLISDGDLLATFLQVVLPVSYEFGPDLVILTWRASSSLLQHDKTSRVACLGHITQLLKGLARGRLLILVENDSDKFSSCGDKEKPLVSPSTHVLLECISVLQGERCKPLSSTLPSNSIVSMIKDLQTSLKEKWQVFKFTGKIPKLSKT